MVTKHFSPKLSVATRELVERYQVDGESLAATVTRLLEERCNGIIGETEGFEAEEIECFQYLKAEERHQVMNRAKIESSTMTAGEMLKLVERFTGQGRNQFVAKAVATYGQRLLTRHLVSRDRATDKGVNEKGEKRGVAGAANDRIEKFFKQYVSDHGKAPTASKVAKAVGTHYDTAKRWLEENAH